MRPNLQDLRALWLPLAYFGAVLLISTLMVWYAASQQAAAARDLQGQKVLLSQARQRYLASGAEREAITKYLPLYRQLVQQGLIGEEHRLEWIRKVHAIDEQYKLFGVSYAIGARENYYPPMQPNLGSFSLHRSAVKMELPLLHEYDLLTLLNAVYTDVPALLLTRNCAIKRRTDAVSGKFAPHLDANCELDMISISPQVRVETKP